MTTDSASAGAPEDGCGSCLSRRSLIGAALAAGGAAVAGGLAPAGAVEARWIILANHGGMEVGQVKRFSKPDGRAWMVTRVRAGAYRGFTAFCTHQGALLFPRPTKIYCPNHGSAFSKRTGERIAGPAQRDLDEFPMRIRRGKIQIFA
jgi:nitrite reductase/ring-hydroxylating ferredoxin subunit